MKALTLFAGAGGADLGLQRAGFEHVRCIEYDRHAHATLCAAGFPGVLGDVRDPALYRDLPPIGFLWASPPCQDWSSAGKREGASGSRNGWPWTWAVVRHLQRRGLGPTWLIAENVTGMLTHSGKDCGKGCCADPAKCPTTYWHEVVMRDARALFPWADYRVICAAAHGTPQFRRRVFLVAGPRPIRWPEPTHGPPTAQASLFGPGLKPYGTMRNALCLGGGVAVIGGGRNPQSASDAHRRTFRDITDEPSTTIAAQVGGNAGNAGPFVVPLAGSEPERLDRPAPCVTTTEAKGTRGDNMGRTLKSGAKAGGVDRASDAMWLATGRRRLTVQECAALFDMPEDYPWQGTKTSQYKQVGNMVAWRCAKALGDAVFSA